MESRKRKVPIELMRRVRVRRDETEPEDDWDGFSEQKNDDESDVQEDGDDSDDDDEYSSESEVNESEASSEPGSPEQELDTAMISFGALAKAQASIQGNSKRRKSRAKASDTEDGPHAKPRDNSTKSGSGGPLWEKKGSTTSAKPEPRKSKHAPEEVTSKRPVSRFREAVKPIGGARPAPRDPRFDRELKTKQDLARFKHNYAFLDEYREEEMKRLREALGQGGRRRKGGEPSSSKRNDKAAALDPEQREQLKRSLASMESQKKARERKDAQERLLEEHRKKEKELVRQGKKPFYLKGSEQKKMLLMDRYAGMTNGQVEKAIERKRKKVAAKEKKELPLVRREGESR